MCLVKLCCNTSLTAVVVVLVAAHTLLCVHPQVLPNWVTTYLLAILLTLMAIRLYVKGRQTYAKETQLLAAAKAATKERRLQHHHRAATSSALLSPTAAAAAAAAADDGVDADGVVAVPQSRRALRHSGSISHSINRSIGRSFSRVRGGSLVVGGFEPGSSLTSPSGFSAAGSTLVSPAAARFYSAATAAAADHDAAAGDDGGGRDAGVVRGSDQQLATGQAVENYINSTLFQVCCLFVGSSCVCQQNVVADAHSCSNLYGSYGERLLCVLFQGAQQVAP